MEYQYNPTVWGPAWLWALGFFLFLFGLVLAVWFLQIARRADTDTTPPREIERRPRDPTS